MPSANTADEADARGPRSSGRISTAGLNAPFPSARAAGCTRSSHAGFGLQRPPGHQNVKNHDASRTG